MQDNSNITDIQLELPLGAREWYPSADTPSALSYQQGGARTGVTRVEPVPSERAAQPTGTDDSRAGSPAASAEQGTEDTSLGDTTSTERLPPSGGERSQNQASRSRKPRIRIATLNIRGCGERRMNGKFKLAHLARWMRANKVGIVALQETYETRLAFEALEKAFEKVWAFPNGGGAHSAGTGFVIHKDNIPAGLKKEDFAHEIIIEGRVSTLTLKWEEEMITIANVYAPNEKRTAETFFERTTSLLKKEKPDMVMGDFNHVKHTLDRLPNRTSVPAATKEALDKIERSLK
ncbi:hypothetical protein FRC01_011821, partial [Tulasnella sp. 417]